MRVRVRVRVRVRGVGTCRGIDARAEPKANSNVAHIGFRLLEEVPEAEGGGGGGVAPGLPLQGRLQHLVGGGGCLMEETKLVKFNKWSEK